MGGSAAREKKKPATHAASSGASESTSSGRGPPSDSRLGSQNAMSSCGFAMAASGQSMRRAVEPSKQTLSLRTSRWTSASR